MPFRLYSVDLPNWSAVRSRFALRSPQPTFVYALSASRYGQYVALAVYSNDGHSFAAAAAIKTGREVPEAISRPLRATRWDLVAGKLAALSPVIAHHRFEDLLPRMFRSTNDLPDYYVVVSGIPCPMHDAEPEASVESHRSEIDDLRVQVPLLRRAADQIDIWRQRFCMRGKHSP